MAYKAEMHVEGGWYGNAIVLETHEEAKAYAEDLYLRWTSPDDRRVVETDEAVNYRFVNFRLIPVHAGDAS
jgi:hypothetical protein